MTPNDLIASWKKAGEAYWMGTGNDTRLLEICQRAYGWIYGLREWSFRKKESTITTVAATAAYDIDGTANDFAWPQPRVTPLKMSDGSEIDYWDKEQYYSRDRTAANAQPTRYHVYWDASAGAYKVVFWPTPDAVYTIYFPYIAKAGTLTGSGSISLPEAFLTAIEAVFYARAFQEFNTNGRYKDQLAAAKADAREAIFKLSLGDRVESTVQPNDVYADVLDQQWIYGEGGWY